MIEYTENYGCIFPNEDITKGKEIVDDTYGFDSGCRYYNDHSPTIRSERVGLKTIDKDISGYRIRKLTPKECWRLMGFSDEDFEKAKYYTKEEVEALGLKKSKKCTDEFERLKTELNECRNDIYDEYQCDNPNFKRIETLEKLKRDLEYKLKKIQKPERLSDTQLYKQAGNSIVVDVLYYIFKELYLAMPYLFDDLKVGSYFSGIGAFESGLNRLYADINNENFIQPQTA